MLGFGMSESMYNSIIVCYTRSHMPDKAIEIFSEALANKITPSRQLYTSLLLAYAYKSDPISAEKVVKEMRAKELSLDSVVYTNLILAYKRAGQIEKCWDVFRRAEIDGAVDQYLLAYMIYICSQVCFNLLRIEKSS